MALAQNYPCVKTQTRNLRVQNFRLDLVDAETKCTGSFYRKKAIEKTILHVLRSSAFSHSLDPKRTSTVSLPRFPPTPMVIASHHCCLGKGPDYLGRSGNTAGC